MYSYLLLRKHLKGLSGNFLCVSLRFGFHHFFALLTELDPDRQIRYPRCCRSGMFIPDPNFSIPDPGPKSFPDPGSGSAYKNLSILNPKNCFQALRNMVRICSSRILDPDFDFLPIPSPPPPPTPPATLYLGCCSREPLRVALDTGGEGDARGSEWTPPPFGCSVSKEKWG